MQLEKGTRSILAYFPSSTRAKNAADEIKNTGMLRDEGDMQIDRVSRYGVYKDRDIDNPINSGATLSGLTIYSSEGGADSGQAPLLAGSDSASGIGSPGAGAAGGSAFLLTVVTSAENVDKAVNIIKTHGGTV